MTAFGDLGSSERLAIWAGVTGRAIEGERASLIVVELAPGSVVDEHRHDNEQLGVCAAGSLTFRIGDETRELRAGDTWRIDSNVLHEVHTGPNGAVVIETFAPARSDWNRLERLEPTSPHWPT